MKYKNGFTLIELLAIIVILAIIGIITTPIVLNVIEKSKKSSSIDSAYGYVGAVNRLYYNNSLDGIDDDIEDGIYSVSELKTMGVSVSGNEPTDGWCELVNGEVVSYSLKIGDYVVTKYSDTDVVAVRDGDIEYDQERRDIANSVDSYVKAALLANSALSDESAKTVAKMDNVTTNVPDSGWIHFKRVNDVVVVIDYSLTYGNLTANYISFTGERYLSSFGNTRNKPLLVQTGDTKCFGEEGSQECFKVIKIFTENGVEKVMLFANYNLKKYTDNSTNPATITYKQGGNSTDLHKFTAISFSESNYWHDTTNNILKSEYARDINGGAATYSGNPYPYVYNLQGTDTNNVKTYVDGYVSILKTIYGAPSSITGRLLTFEEAANSEMFADSNARKIDATYWLGSAENGGDAVKSVESGGNISWSIYSSERGVRPVIIVPMDDL